MIQALLSRSDRRLAPVIAAVRGKQDSLGGWKKAYRAARAGDLPMAESAGVELPVPPAWDHVVHDTWPDDTVLPWDHLRTTLKKETLQHHRIENLRSE